MKVVKSDWRSKLKQEDTEALLRIKVERPEIEQFIKKHSSDAAEFWQGAKEQKRREWEKEKNIRNTLERLNGFGLQTN